MVKNEPTQAGQSLRQLLELMAATEVQPSKIAEAADSVWQAAKTGAATQVQLTQLEQVAQGDGQGAQAAAACEVDPSELPQKTKRVWQLLHSSNKYLTSVLWDLANCQ